MVLTPMTAVDPGNLFSIDPITRRWPLLYTEDGTIGCLQPYCPTDGHIPFLNRHITMARLIIGITHHTNLPHLPKGLAT